MLQKPKKKKDKQELPPRVKSWNKMFTEAIREPETSVFVFNIPIYAWKNIDEIRAILGVARDHNSEPTQL